MEQGAAVYKPPNEKQQAVLEALRFEAHLSCRYFTALSDDPHPTPLPQGEGVRGGTRDLIRA